MNAYMVGAGLMGRAYGRCHRKFQERKRNPAECDIDSAYSGTRVDVSRKHISKVDATLRERRPCTILNRPQ